MSEIPWWGLPLIAAVFALVGAVVAQLVTVRNESARKRTDKTTRWYEERKSAYVALLAAFERTTLRLRRGFAAGVIEPDPLLYLDEVGSPLTQVRLLASGPVRSAGLAVHLLLEDMHGPRPKPVPGRETEQHFLEKLAHVPLLMHEFEVAVREELDIDIDADPPGPPGEEDPEWRRRARSLVGRPRAAKQESVASRS